MGPTVERRALRVSGVVQGVGFRPFVYRLALELGLTGQVGNDEAGVFIEVQGRAGALDTFITRLARDAPPLAVVRSIDTCPAAVRPGEHGFHIVESAHNAGARTALPPDVAVCAACLAEVLDPADRRYRYPFANCTECGPRLSIICDLPYDRPATTMAAFALCAACSAEYTDPADRRYHAQPIACPTCGPQVRFTAAGTGTVTVTDDVAGTDVTGTDAVIAAFHRAIGAGHVVAVKGVGGYHLACDATNETAVARLRARKRRGAKPFAVMMPTIDAVRELAEVSLAEADALTCPAAPIVLLRRHATPATGAVRLALSVAPSNPMVGVMLPYTPLHHLLFHAVPDADTHPPQALVLTSGNLADEPICTDDGEARQRLADLADAFMWHDRAIHVPVDDSVVRVVDRQVQPVRRSRGYAPVPVALPFEVMPVLAVGGELKNTFCMAVGRQAWVSQHIGDMENLETLAAFERGVEGFGRMYDVTPQVVATDRHPGYLTRRWAADHAAATGVPMVEVQHHHAHVAAGMAEHGVPDGESVVGVAFDGTGFGTSRDGAPELWGGELLVATYDKVERVGHLRALPMPGGDSGVRSPCRVAVAWLAALGIDAPGSMPAVEACDSVELSVVRRQVATGAGCVPTTSVGRLFDVVASLLGVRHRVEFEAQAAMELEALAMQAATPADVGWLVLPFERGVFDTGALLRGLVAAQQRGVATDTLAFAFHHALAWAVGDAVAAITAQRGPHRVVLTGGVFQNALLHRLTCDVLGGSGHEVLTHRVVPANDGGISLGQAVVAARTMQGGS